MFKLMEKFKKVRCDQLDGLSNILTSRFFLTLKSSGTENVRAKARLFAHVYREVEKRFHYI